MSPLFEVKDILRATDAVLEGGPEENVFKGVSIDSRKIGPGELFWAIKGERFDGSSFIMEAAERGASGVVSEKGIANIPLSGDIAKIKVGSSLEALHRLAAYNRKRHAVPLVAITGSNGKTTTKEILASILKKRFEVLKNEGNLNNLIGVPLTLLKLHSDHEVAVVEMGMNSRGEISQLTKMAMPDIGVITNIGEAHLEGLGSLENVKRAKGELLEAMKEEGTVVLNADDSAVMELALQAKSDVVTFGFSGKANVRASDAEVDWGKGTLFSLSAGDETLPVLLPLYGMHQLYNALAAAAVAYSMGFKLAEIREALEEFEACSGRMEIISRGGITIINDSYNANPSSVRSAIEAMICSLEARKIAVIGDMLEMGEDEERIHFELGRFIAEKGMDILFTLGSLARNVAAGAADAGMDAANIFSFDDRKELGKRLIAEARERDLILIKGSRGMRMEDVTVALKDELKRPGEED